MPLPLDPGAPLRARLAALCLDLKFMRASYALRLALTRKDDDDEGPDGDADDLPAQLWTTIQYAQAAPFSPDHNGPPERLPDENPQPAPPDIPPEKPTEPGVLSATLRSISQSVDSWATLAALTSPVLWVQVYIPDIVAYGDPPKTFDELQEGVGEFKPGYEDHHIVEQTSAARDGFPRDMIDSRDNVVKIPRLTHREITTWYGAPNKDYGMLTPRQYLSGRPWNERYSLGIEQLIEKGVLKP